MLPALDLAAPPRPVGILAAVIADFVRRCPDELAGGDWQRPPLNFYTAARATELMATQQQMIAAPYVADSAQYRLPDYWAVNVAGDCEDKALWAHRRLAAMGWPKASMRLWLCRARVAGAWRGHAVLVIRLAMLDPVGVPPGSWSDGIEAALDCLRSTPARRQDLGYRNWQMVDPDKYRSTPNAGAPPPG